MPLNSEFDDLGDDDGERASILIVDDLPEKLLVFRTVLEDLGHELVCARSGAEALKEILKTEFAAILLDVNMPDIDGFETAKLIRQYKRSARTPIIFVTSYADEMQTIRGYSLGAVDYILSPVVPDILRSKVKVFVDLHLTQRRLRRRADERVALAAAEAARQVAEENTRRSHFLSQASRVLGSSLDSDVAANAAARDAGAALRQRGDARALRRPAASTSSSTATSRPRAERACGGAAPSSSAPPRRELLTPRSTPAAAAPAPAGAARRSWSCRCRAPTASSARSAFGRATGPTDAGIGELIERSAIALENARLYRTLQVEIEERRGVEALLQASNQRKDEFLAMLSHELRNPLAPIRTALEVIRRLAPAEPKLTWATDVTGRQVAQLTRLVEDLLDVARINQGKIALQIEPLDLRAVVAHAVETARPFIDGRTPPAQDRGPGHADRDARRFRAPVAGRRQPAQQRRQVHRGGRPDRAGADAAAQGQAVVSVRDNGMGIEAELLPNVFELFEQGKRSLDRSQGGLGVGLTLVHRLVGLHHGTVTATSAGAGPRLRVPGRAAVPERGRRAKRCAAAHRRPRADAARAACRILVVDDNHDAAEATAVFLELGGHEVKTVGDGSEALASAPVFAPDVVLLDIGLPEMDGYEVARRLREIAADARVVPDRAHRLRPARRSRAGARGGFDHHLTKPADPDALLALVDAWIESPARQRAPARAPRAAVGNASTDARSGARPRRGPCERPLRKNFLRAPPLITLCITRLRSCRRRLRRRAPASRRARRQLFEQRRRGAENRSARGCAERVSPLTSADALAHYTAAAGSSRSMIRRSSARS